MSAASLALSEVSLGIEGRWLFSRFSLAVPAGGAVALMGPSGVGKSSLLLFASGLLPSAFARSGRVLLGERDVSAWPAERRRLGMLFQDDLLFPHMSVGENLAFGLAPEVRGRAARERAVAAALEEAELAGFARRDPATLSGGQRARVALMRVLLSRPAGLLLDEPFARLDRNLRERFRRFVFAAASARGLPVLLATHDAEDAAAAGGSVVALAAADC